MMFNKNEIAARTLKELEIDENELLDINHPSYIQRKEKIIKNSQSGDIDLQQLSAIASLAPHLADLTKVLSAQAGRSQEFIIKSHENLSQHALELQGRVIEKSASEETLRKASDNIAKMNERNNHAQEAMNKSNNRFYKEIIIGTVIVLAVGLDQWRQSRRRG